MTLLGGGDRTNVLLEFRIGQKTKVTKDSPCDLTLDPTPSRSSQNTAQPVEVEEEDEERESHLRQHPWGWGRQTLFKNALKGGFDKGYKLVSSGLISGARLT